MGQITEELLEWTVINRLQQMLDDPPSQDFRVTEAFALFSSILCWVMQHTRIPNAEARTRRDRSAQRLLRLLGEQHICEPHWGLAPSATPRRVEVGGQPVTVPPGCGFAGHTADRFLKNLRDAMAHGDRRNVKPFNSHGLLLGFTFHCSEARGRGNAVWRGEITLLRDDMRRIGSTLAQLYCAAMADLGRVPSEVIYQVEAQSIREPEVMDNRAA